LLHLGGNTVVPTKDLVAILSLDTAKPGTATSEFLQLVHDEGFVQRIAEAGKEKSFVITRERIYLSPISAITLAKRASEFKYTLSDAEA
jgi:hypothetical protein